MPGAGGAGQAVCPDCAELLDGGAGQTDWPDCAVLLEGGAGQADCVGWALFGVVDDGF